MCKLTKGRAAALAIALGLGVFGCAKSGVGVGVVTEPGEPDEPGEQVVFNWSSGSQSLSGDISTTLPSGETYRGRFLEITSDATVPSPFHYSYTWYDWEWPYSAPYLQTVTQYSGDVVAQLSSPQGNTMRCYFRLEDPASGLAGGAVGSCRTSEGTTVDSAVFRRS